MSKAVNLGTFADDISVDSNRDVTLSNLRSDQPMMFRNKIINGDMRISQRGDSTGVTTTTYGGPDRFQSILGTAGTWSLSKSTDAPSGSGFSNSFKWDCITANNSLSASSILMFGQKIEGQNVQDLAYGTSSAKNITLSFWVKSNLTGTYILEFFKETGSRQINRSYTINAANTWEHKSVTIPGDTSGALANDNTAEFAVYWWLVAGSDFTSGTLNTSAWANSTNANRAVGQVNLASSTSNEIYITGVQLEVGTVPTPFEHRPLSVELAMCQRYYEKSFNLNTAPANNTSEQTVVYSHQQSGYGTAIPLSFRVRKRATASLIIYNPFDTTANRAAWIASSNQAFTHSDVHGITETGFTVINYSIPSGTTPDTSGNMIAFNWSADAEL